MSKNRHAKNGLKIKLFWHDMYNLVRDAEFRFKLDEFEEVD